MPHLRPLALLAFLAATPVAMANPAPPPSVRDRTPDPKPTMIDPETGQPVPIRETRRTGPFRSCGSGAGLGLAGIGIAWGLMWIGGRFGTRVARRQR